MVKEERKEWAEDLYFSQLVDAPWKDLPYWEGKIDYNGCGLVSLTHCIDLLTGQELTPEDVYRIREKAGLAQDRVVDLEGTSVCGGDVQRQLNPVNERLFGIRSFGMERTVEDFKRVLAMENTVIWASSNETEFYDKAGTPRVIHCGHVLCFWKYEDGVFYAKDSDPGKELGNNVPYTEEMLEKWLRGQAYQHWAVTTVEGEADEK